jgi:DNA polymerase-3 subunit gamma/tau
MFRKSRSGIGTTSPTPSAMPATATNKHITENTQEQKTITNDILNKAWTSFALQLPENERALADRMKIITPSINGNDSFTISVDNQMAAELFEKEALHITKGMSKDLNNQVLKMIVKINEVVVERHTSDKGKQYEILKEKNPLIEKLRQELNLELTR